MGYRPEAGEALALGAPTTPQRGDPGRAHVPRGPQRQPRARTASPVGPTSPPALGTAGLAVFGESGTPAHSLWPLSHGRNE